MADTLWLIFGAVWLAVIIIFPARQAIRDRDFRSFALFFGALLIILVIGIVTGYDMPCGGDERCF